MKKLIFSSLVISILNFTPASAEHRGRPDSLDPAPAHDRGGCHSSLTPERRLLMWTELNWCMYRMHKSIADSDAECALIRDFNTRKATRAVITGAIAGLSTRNPYGIIIAGALSGIAEIAGEGYDHFCLSRDHLKSAAYYADRADTIQDSLLYGIDFLDDEENAN